VKGTARLEPVHGDELAVFPDRFEPPDGVEPPDPTNLPPRLELAEGLGEKAPWNWQSDDTALPTVVIDLGSAPAPRPPDREPKPDRTPPADPIVLMIPGTAIAGSWFETMESRLAADGFDPVIYETPDQLTESLATGAARIGAVVSQLLTESGQTQIDIIGESNGGIAARYYVQHLGGAVHVRHLVTLLSPHQGSWLSLLGFATGWQALADATPGSAFLALLNSGPLPATPDITAIYSCHDEFQWPIENAILPGATNVAFCNHVVSHFAGFTHALVYGRIRASLRGRGAEAPNAY
jgi:hypothetical protein